MTNRRYKRGGQYQRAESTAQCFVWAGLRRDFAMPKSFAGDVGKDIIQFHRQNDQHYNRTKIGVVRHVTKMTKAMAEQQKTKDPKSNPLGITARFIAQNRNHRQQHHSERRNRDKESVPMIRDREGGRNDAKHQHDAERALTEKSG